MRFQHFYFFGSAHNKCCCPRGCAILLLACPQRALHTRTGSCCRFATNGNRMLPHAARGQTLDLHAAATFLCRSNPLAINCLARNYFVVKMGAFTHKHTRIPAHTHTDSSTLASYTGLVYPMHNLGFCS